MRSHSYWAMALAGGLAGAVNGLFGAGGGMVLIPLLTMLAGLNPEEVFPASVSIILPVCLVSLLSTALTGTIAWREALVWLPGSAAGGILAGFFGKRIPVKWLHRGLGLLIFWGGIRYLW